MEDLHKKHTRLGGWFVLFVTLGTFLYTVSPTVAFWDCGEYIGASHSLAIPHPPGNPLYVLLGRVFSMIFFFFRQVAYRVNLISVFSAAVTAVLLYLIIVRTMVSWIGVPDDRWKRITVYLSGIVGAFFAVFGYTFWFSAVEASVYVPSTFIIVLCTWLAIKWSQSNDPGRDRLLILFTYIGFLGIGVHMMSMLALIPVGLYILLSDETKLKDWRLWITVIIMMAVIYHVSLFLWLGPLTVAITLIMSIMEKGASKKWRFCFWIAFFALLGYSVHLYIPIRSTVEPMIDENHPVVRIDESGQVDWLAFKHFLERKQYGSESMITRMFHRLGAWNKQFGVDGHMGYGGFHITQFFHFGRSIGIDRNDTVFKNWGPGKGFFILLIYLIPTMVMLYGWSYLYKRNKKLAILLIFLFLMGSVILVLYMNFADGTRPMKRDYLAWVKNGKQGPMPTFRREVRIRDYFFTPGFTFFGMWIGLALGCILHALFTSKNNFIRSQLAPIVVVLFAVSPALPLTQNFKENTRRFDWVPFDYAYNLLMSCEKDGILFTGGDNDTFPLWFLQEASGIRRDVRIVNLSLLNTKWYIKQLKRLDPKIPISYSEDFIAKRLDHKLNPLEKTVAYKMPKAGITVGLPGRDKKQILQVADQMVINIVDSNKWKRPLYFAATMSPSNFMGLDPFLQLQGLVYRIKERPLGHAERIDLERSLFLIDKVYNFRSLGDGKIPLSETNQNIVSTYANAFFTIGFALRGPLYAMKGEIAKIKSQLSDAMLSADSLALLKADLEGKEREYSKNLDIVINKLDQCIGIMPWEWQPRYLQQEFLVSHDRPEQGMEKIKQARRIEPGRNEFVKLEAQLLKMQGEKLKGEATNGAEIFQ